MSGNFDVGLDTRKIIEAKVQRRADLRQQFLKLRTNPFAHASGEGGTVFDPALLRYQALKVSGYDYFKPSGKNAFVGLAFLVVPLLGYFSLLYTTKHAQEAKYRRGEVAYKDRNFKFI